MESPGIDLAESQDSATLRLSLTGEFGKTRGGGKQVMRELKRIVMAVLIGAMISVGALAQKGGSNDNRPPKEKPKVVDRGKDNPPPSNSNSNKRGKP